VDRPHLDGVVSTLRTVAAGAGTILAAVQQEYPNAPRHVMVDASDQVTPRSAHPAFYGCYDWHSAVEMHWALIVLLRFQPDDVPADEIRAVVDAHLTVPTIAAELAYLTGHPDWERPYGWGWVLQLAGELEDWAATGDPDAIRWAAAVRPLAAHVSQALLSWLPRLTYPDRSGTHGNTAFSLSRALAWPEASSRQAIEKASRAYFEQDADFPVRYDFLSPFFAEALLMSEVLDATEFGPWWARFAPAEFPESFLTPAVVTDAEDGQGAHLHGLNLYRIRGLRRLLPCASAAQRRVFETSLRAHEQAAEAALADAAWMAEHWLGAYAVLAFR
jgi:Protein of unknown function (DUF2891)